MNGNTPPPPPFSSPSGSLPPAPPPRGWWGRNWRWFLPVGCFGILALVGVFVLALVIFVFGAIKSTEGYKNALAAAQSNPEVIEALGTPIEDGMFVSGKTESNGASGAMEMMIPISGPKGKGKIFSVGAKSAGQWQMSKLEVEIEKTGQRINLLEGNNNSGDDDEADPVPTPEET